MRSSAGSLPTYWPAGTTAPPVVLGGGSGIATAVNERGAIAGSMLVDEPANPIDQANRVLVWD